MRAVLTLALLLALGYGAYRWWFPPSATAGLLHQAAFSVEDRHPEVGIAPAGGVPFRLLPGGTDYGYHIVRDAFQLTDEGGKADRLVAALRALRIDSLLVDGRPHGRVVGLRLRGVDRLEEAELIFPSGADRPVALSYRGQPDYFALSPTAHRLADQLHFDHFRSRLLVEQPDLHRGADSLVLQRGDSLHYRLRDRVGAETVAALLRPPAAAYADFFDELQFADRHLGELLICRPDRTHRIGVYRDSLWPQPYVLVSRDFRRRYLGVDSLPYVKLPDFPPDTTPFSADVR